VKRIAELLDIEKDLVYFNFAEIGECTSWEVENKLEEELSNDKSNRMFVYDEFQYAATLNPKTGEEYDNKTGLKTFWELLDSGMLHKRGEFWNVRTPLKVLEFMSKICLKCHMDIKDGVWVNAEECLKDFKAYDIQKFREVFNFELENTHEIKQQDENRTITSEVKTLEPKSISHNEDVTPFFIKESYLERIIGLYDKSTGQVSDVLDIYHRLEKMNCDQIIDFIFEVYESAKKSYDLKFNDSIIFVIANQSLTSTTTNGTVC
jgi:hypothetical protein